MTIEKVIFFVLLVDALVANGIALVGAKWYLKHFRTLSRWFPIGKGWTVLYLLLVLWIGSLVYRL